MNVVILGFDPAIDESSRSAIFENVDVVIHDPDEIEKIGRIIRLEKERKEMVMEIRALPREELIWCDKIRTKGHERPYKYHR